MEFDEKLFGDRLRRTIIAKGITNSELAKMLGYSGVMVGYWCNGKRKVTLNNLIEIAKALGVSSDYLLGLKDTDESVAIIINRNFSAGIDKCIKALSILKEEGALKLEQLG